MAIDTERKFEYSWLSDDIIYFKYTDNAVIGLSDVEKMLELQKELGINESCKRIVHTGTYTTITSSARKHIETYKPKARAEAFIITSLPQRIMFNLYSKVRSKVNPIKSFDDLESAEIWLNQF